MHVDFEYTIGIQKIVRSSGTVSFSFLEEQVSFFLPPSMVSIIPPILMGYINGAITPNKVAHPKSYLAINGIDTIISIDRGWDITS
jgi:hypothetical protein